MAVNLKIPAERALDIDTEFDMRVAALLLEHWGIPLDEDSGFFRFLPYDTDLGLSTTFCALLALDQYSQMHGINLHRSVPMRTISAFLPFSFMILYKTKSYITI